ncbi:MAG: PilZ domain-containing protein [Deltaproteobacteria bacterium]|nr:PilZ domain-containing protein [Deltaproteobacteria bacterium]
MPEDTSGAERRQNERFELLVQVGLRRSDHSDVCSVINISAGGVLLRNDRNVTLAVGEHIRVQFDAPELAAAFSIDAKVIRVISPSGKAEAVAAMWTSSDAAASTGLAQVLWSLSQRR